VQKFTESLWFVVAFLFATALLRVFAGEKMTIAFLALVLVGMMLFNVSKFSDLLGAITSKEA